jgi:hypothetical protein
MFVTEFLMKNRHKKHLRTMRHLHRFSVAASLGIFAAAANAAVTDIYPTDFVALPNGSVNVTIYGAQQKITGPYANGVARAGDASAHQVVLRASRVFAAGDNQQYAWAPVLVLGYADIHTNPTLCRLLGSSNASGMADLRVGNAFWFHIDRPNRTYGLVALFASLPTGEHNASSALNVGENRTRYVLSAGWMQPIVGKWLVDISPEIAMYGDDNRYRGTSIRTQDTSYALTSYLRYRQSDIVQFYGGAQINRGGATQVGGVQTIGAPDNTRLYLGGIWFTSPKQQWQLRYSKDVQIENGLRSAGEISLRYLISID